MSKHDDSKVLRAASRYQKTRMKKDWLKFMYLWKKWITVIRKEKNNE